MTVLARPRPRLSTPAAALVSELADQQIARTWWHKRAPKFVKPFAVELLTLGLSLGLLLLGRADSTMKSAEEIDLNAAQISWFRNVRRQIHPAGVPTHILMAAYGPRWQYALRDGTVMLEVTRRYCGGHTAGISSLWLLTFADNLLDEGLLLSFAV